MDRLINFILTIALIFHIFDSAYLYVPIKYAYKYLYGRILCKEILLDRKCDRLHD